MKPLRNARNAAFTLLEIMLVVMIIALLAGSAIYLMGDNVDVAKRIKVDSDIKAVSTQLMIYQNLNGFLPTPQQGLGALVEKPTSEPIPRRWQRLMSDLPVDPWGAVYVLETPPRRSKEKYDLFSKGEDGQPNTADDIGNW